MQSEKCEIHCVIYGSEKLREDWFINKKSTDTSKDSKTNRDLQEKLTQ